MRNLRFLLCFVSLSLVSCTQDHIAVMPVAPASAHANETEVFVPADPERWAGRFQLSGAPSEDTCGGAVILAAEHVVIDAGARTLEADVVDRRYEVTDIAGEGLVAEGRFATDVCPQSTLFERWTLQHNGDAWTGTLDSTWPDHTNCERACTVRFEIRATRLPE
ncbi:MAG: hypothetical protein AB8H86_30905 [Polyangiales bacterium]